MTIQILTFLIDLHIVCRHIQQKYQWFNTISTFYSPNVEDMNYALLFNLYIYTMIFLNYNICTIALSRHQYSFSLSQAIKNIILQCYQPGHGHVYQSIISPNYSISKINISFRLKIDFLSWRFHTNCKCWYIPNSWMPIKILSIIDQADLK